MERELPCRICKFLLTLVLLVTTVTSLFAQDPPNCGAMSTLPVRTCVNGNALYTPSVNPESIGKAVTWTMTVNTTGAIFVETGTSAPLHKVLTGTPADVVAVKVGPNAGTLTIVLTYDGSSEGSCSASRIVRKVAVTANYPPLKCAQDLATITAVATTQSQFNGPFVPSPPYLYTLLPENIQNLTGVFVGVASGPHTILAKENMLEGCDASFDINVIAPPVIPLNAFCPPAEEHGACEYANLTQDQVNALVKAFVDKFDVTGGTGLITKEKVLVPANGIVDKCGGLLTVTVKGVDECQQKAECTATFKINAAPAVVPVAPNPVVVKFCELTTEDALKQQFADFIKGFSVSGGCAPKLEPLPHGEPNFCGDDGITVRFNVVDACFVTKEISSTFKVERPEAPKVDQGVDDHVLACVTQADLDIRWNAFLKSVLATGSCGPLDVAAEGVKPDRCKGGTVPVKFTIKARCFDDIVITKNFIVDAATEPKIDACPADKDLGCNPLGLPAAENPKVTSLCDYKVEHTDGAVQGDACNKFQIRTFKVFTECFPDGVKCEQKFTWKADAGISDLKCPEGKDFGCNPIGDFIPPAVDPTFVSNCPAKVSSVLGPVTNTDCFYKQVRTYTVATDCFPEGVKCDQVFTWKVDKVGPIITGLVDKDVEGGDEDSGLCSPTTTVGGPAIQIPVLKGSSGISVDFGQVRTGDAPDEVLGFTNGTTTAQSEYFEGMGVPQRILLQGLNKGKHVFYIKHQAVKKQDAARHAYDFFMSWDQAIATGENIGNGTRSELKNLNNQECDGHWSGAGQADCKAMTNNAFADIPDTMGNPPDQTGIANVDDVIKCFEGIYGNRQVELEGKKEIKNVKMNFLGYTGDEDKSNYAWYTIEWESDSDVIEIKLAGRMAMGGGKCGYGNCHGAGSIKGNPYHIILAGIDGKNIGNRDNQTKCKRSQTCDVNIPVKFDTPKATDCDPQVVTPTIVAGKEDVITKSPDGLTVTHCRTWEAFDKCGNRTEATQCIRVVCFLGANFGDLGLSKLGTTTAKTVGYVAPDSDTNNILAPNISRFVAYPNPFRSNFQVDINTTNPAPMSINVYDVLGKNIDLKTFNPDEANSLRIGEGYPTGIYNVILNQATEVKTLRVIKQ